MFYAVGTHIDLSHTNTKRVMAAAVAQKKSISQSIVYEKPQRTLWPVGTRFIYNKITGTWDRKIPVAFA